MLYNSTGGTGVMAIFFRIDTNRFSAGKILI